MRVRACACVTAEEDDVRFRRTFIKSQRKMNDQQGLMNLIGDDDVLRRILALSLEDVGGHQGPPPTSQYGLQEELIDIEVTEKHLKKQDACVICADEFIVGEYAKKIPCGHFFHDRCIMQWVVKVGSAMC